ncbi:DNA replication and repair protein RecF [Dehalococcoidia bacterium]|nr:DNA replication and repair protein RecF [Dehalococcoidia bacterium]
MHLSDLTLLNYRNFADLELDLPKGLILLYGDNAQGKSNLIEAIYLLSIAKSYKAGNERETLQLKQGKSSDKGHVIGVFHNESDKFRVMVDMQLVGSTNDVNRQVLRKDITLNGTQVSASALLGNINAVLFTVDDIELIVGSPSTRRKFLDILICRIDKIYLRALQKYQRVLFQRNHLLRLIRDRKASVSELEFWNDSLIYEGSYITMKRKLIVDELTSVVTPIYQKLTNTGENISLSYEPGLLTAEFAFDDLQSRFRATLYDALDREISQGVSQYGPQRDEVKIFLDGMDSSVFASRGQSRTLALSLKLSEGNILHKETSQSPIILLDDVFSELDDSRRNLILDHVSLNEQVFVSSNDKDVLGNRTLQHCTPLLVNNGLVSR